jgi:hypothetical protein
MLPIFDNLFPVYTPMMKSLRMIALLTFQALAANGRSTPGSLQKNDLPVNLQKKGK